MTNSSENIEVNGKRLSAKSILYKVSRQLPYLLLYGYFGIYQNSGVDWIFLILALFGAVFIIPATILSYLYFKYLITPDELIIQSGVVNRKQRNIQLHRIQNVNIHQNFLQRIMGISTVKMETAGDATSEAVLDSVSKSNANEIREIIRNYQAEIEEKEEIDTESEIEEDKDSEKNYIPYDSNPDTFDSTSKDSNDTSIEYQEKSENSLKNKFPKKDYKSSEEKELISMSFWDVVNFGQLRFRPILLIGVGWFMSFFNQFMPNEFQNIETYVNRGIEDYVGSFDYYSVILYVISAIAIGLVISWVVDIVLTIFQYYGFKLSLQGNKLYTNYGLLSKRQGAIPLKKLQMLILHTNAIRNKFGYWALNLETAGTAGREGRTPETVVPFAKLQRVIDLAKGIRIFNLPEEYTPVSRKTIRRAFLRYTWLITILTIILYQITDFWWLTSLFLPIIYIVSNLRWKTRGYHLEGKNIIVKDGWFFKKVKIIPVSKIQNIIIKSNFFQQKMDLSSVFFDTAAASGFNDASIIDIKTEDAIEISKQISSIFHSTNIKPVV